MTLVVSITIMLCITTLPTTYTQVYQLEGEPETGYSLSVRLGTPPQQFRVLVDSGSSNFAVAGSHFSYIEKYPFFNTSLSQSFRDIDINVGLRYVEGEWSGRVGRDNFSLSVGDSRSTVVYISVMEDVSGHFFKSSNGWVGILGMGYADLAKPDSSVLPVMDSLVAAGVTADKFGLQLCGPETKTDGTLLDKGGRMSLGSGTPLLPSNSDVFSYAEITEKSFYEIVLTNIKVGSESLDVHCTILNKMFSIIDSGTTELTFNEETFSALIAKLKKSSKLLSKIDIPESFWSGASALGWKRGSDEEFRSFETLEISLQMPDNPYQELSIVIPPQLYLKKVSEKSINLEKGDYCETMNCSWYKLGIKQTPQPSVSTVLGMMLFKGYTVEFDRGGARVGFAPSACDINGLHNPSEVLKIAINQRAVTTSCAYSTDTGLSGFEVILCIFVVIVVISMLVLISIGGGCLFKKYLYPSKVSSTQARDLENMLLRTSSSDSDGPAESDEDLIN